MTDDLLISFRSEVPPPKEATAQQIYARATSGQRPVLTGRFIVGVAVGAAALAATGFGVSALVQGSRSGTPDALSVPPPAATNLFGSDGERVTMSQLLKDDPSLPLPDFAARQCRQRRDHLGEHQRAVGDRLLPVVGHRVGHRQRNHRHHGDFRRARSRPLTVLPRWPFQGCRALRRRCRPNCHSALPMVTCFS